MCSVSRHLPEYFSAPGARFWCRLANLIRAHRRRNRPMTATKLARAFADGHNLLGILFVAFTSGAIRAGRAKGAARVIAHLRRPDTGASSRISASKSSGLIIARDNQCLASARARSIRVSLAQA